jgi:hypothetical protein
MLEACSNHDRWMGGCSGCEAATERATKELISKLERDNARLRVALEEITTSHPKLVTRGGGPAPWLVAKAALLNIPIDAEEVIHQWRKTEPRVAR